MGFFDKFLKAIGFESEDEEQVYEKDKKQKKESLTVSKFDLSKTKNTSSAKYNSFKNTQEEQQLEIYSPSSQSELEMLVLKVQKGENVLINLINFAEDDRLRVLDYLSGAMFLLKCKIKKIEGNLYLINRYQGD